MYRYYTFKEALIQSCYNFVFTLYVYGQYLPVFF